jgi:hypothetical protein
MKVVFNENKYVSITKTATVISYTFHSGVYKGSTRSILRRPYYTGINMFKLDDIKRNKA